MLESHGASRILASFHDIVPNWIFAGLYFSKAYLQEHPDTVRKVLQGLVQSFDYIAAHEKEARAYLPKYTSVDQALCMLAALREYAPVEPMNRIKKQVDLMVNYGYIKNRVSLDPMIDYTYLPPGMKHGDLPDSGGN